MLHQRGCWLPTPGVWMLNGSAYALTCGEASRLSFCMLTTVDDYERTLPLALPARVLVSAQGCERVPPAPRAPPNPLQRTLFVGYMPVVLPIDRIRGVRC